MSVLAMVGHVNEIGQIQVEDEVILPYQTRVYVVVPGLLAEAEVLEKIQVFSPRLKYSRDLSAFLLESVMEDQEEADGNV